MLRALLEVIRREGYELIHTHLHKSNVIGVLAARLSGRPSILHDHAGMDPQSLAYYLPQRVLRAGTVEKLERTSGAGRLLRAVRNAVAFQKLSGTRWSDMIREGLAMKRSRELTWSQVVMAANAPMLYRAALLEGRADVGVMATGQVVGLIDDLPSCQELIDRIVAEATEILRRLGA